MSKILDLIGQRFGRLTVVERAENKGKQTRYLCRCDCGKENIFYTTNLTRGLSTSCGCLRKEKSKERQFIDLTGQKFNHLTVIERDGSDHRGEAKWLCECDCILHSRISVLGSNLRTGHTQSCGCERRSHGELKVAQLLIENQIPFEQEKIMFKYANGRNAKFDFYIGNKYLIEYDGETHFKANLHGWHNLEQLQAQQERDILKNQWCKDNNIPLIRIPYTHYDNLCIEDLLLETSKFIIS